MTTTQQQPTPHAAKLIAAGVARLYSGEKSYRVDVLGPAVDHTDVRVRFQSTGRTDVYPAYWLHCTR